ncbi:EamA family transporter [Ponticaulis profundi]|uniref:EamA family transporter n=1 Tax=Ponticaulis profundi TaxID=2665222 RepID=A0ABW1S945_9PROT
MSPDTLAIGLGLFSAFSLASVNLFVKASGDILVVRSVLSTSCALVLLPFAFFVPLPTPELWGAIAISVAMHMFYQSSLIRAMHRGDLSLVFPVMRGLAPLLVAIASFVVLKESLSAISWFGLFVSVCAVISFGFLQGQKVGAARRISRSALFWAGMTALGVMLYSVFDARGIRQAENPMTFIVWIFLLDWIGVTTVALYERRDGFIEAVKPVLRKGIVSGVLSVLSYGAALYAFTLIEAARVTALRETAVIFGAAMGWMFLKERLGPRRIIASVILALGLALMELGAI